MEIKRKMASGILALSLALGAPSTTLLVNNINEIRRDPNYIVASKLLQAREKVYDAAHHLDYVRVGSINPKSYSYSYKGQGEPSRLSLNKPEMNAHLKEAVKQQKKACEDLGYLDKLENKHRSYALNHAAENLVEINVKDTSKIKENIKELREIGDSYTQLRKTYQEKALAAHLDEGTVTGLAGVVASLAGGVLGTVMLVDERKKRRLEGKVSSTTTVLGLVGGISLLSPNITGNAILGLTNQPSNILGVSLIIVGLLAGLVWVGKKKLAKLVK